MFLLLYIVVGWVGGWLFGRSREGKGYGPSMDVVWGIAGGALGGLLMFSAGLSGYGKTVLTTLAAMVCAVFFTTLTGLMLGRRIVSRQLCEFPTPDGSKNYERDSARKHWPSGNIRL